MLTNENIENLKRRVDKLKQARRRDEKETCKRLIVPTLRLLEWDDSDEDVVEDEYYIPGLQNDSNGNVDYALFAKKGKPAVFVEAKKLGNLGDGGVKQLKQYGLKHIVERGTGNLAFLVLTDGNDWQFHPLSKGLAHYGDWCHKLNIEKDDTSEIKDGLNNLLDRQQVLSGESSRYLEKQFRLHRIDHVLWPILSGTDEALVNLVESKMADLGHELKREEIKEAIQDCLVPRPVEASPNKQDHENPPSPGSSTVTIIQVEYDGKIVEGADSIIILGNVLTLFAGTCGGMGKVAEACKGIATNPTVMTSEEAREFMRARKSYKTRPFRDPKYIDYEYFAPNPNSDKQRRIETLAEALGISERVKVEVVPWE